MNLQRLDPRMLATAMHPEPIAHSFDAPCRPMELATPLIAPGGTTHQALSAQPFAPSDPETVGRRRTLDGKRVLIVEDEMIPALEIELSIEDEGGTALGPIQTVEDGLTFLAENEGGDDIDVAILDVSLHGNEVFPVAEVLRERGVPFLFHTGHGAREDLQQRFPGAPVCSKPMVMESLLDMAGRLIVD